LSTRHVEPALSRGGFDSLPFSRATALTLASAEKVVETLAPQKVGLLWLVQPIDHFFDEQSLLGPVRFTDIDMGERSRDLTSKPLELQQGERSSVHV
jgi:hypothetical protein